MCGHVFFYHDRHPLQRHRPVWQCGTCGRVSSVPIDCCAHPDFGQHHPAGLMHLLGRWIVGCARWLQAGIRSLWWQRYPATRAGSTPAMASPHSVVTVGVMMPTADHDGSSEGDEVAMAAGAHQ